MVGTDVISNWNIIMFTYLTLFIKTHLVSIIYNYLLGYHRPSHGQYNQKKKRKHSVHCNMAC